VTETIVEVNAVWKQFVVRHERRPSVKRFVTRMLRPFPTDKIWALQEVSLAVAPGEAVGVIGRNGSGKSTLLRLIAGIYVPTEGTVTVQGRAGGLFELAAGFHPELSGRDNIRLSGALMGYSNSAVLERLEAIAEYSELEDFVNVPVKSYSSGMALRLGFAIAVAFEPEVLLVDEVLAVADEHFQRKCYRRLQELQKQGSAVLLVSHELVAVRGLCRRVVWLDSGKLRADGPSDEVIEQYLAEVGEDNEA